MLFSKANQCSTYKTFGAANKMKVMMYLKNECSLPAFRKEEVPASSGFRKEEVPAAMLTDAANIVDSLENCEVLKSHNCQSTHHSWRTLI